MKADTTAEALSAGDELRFDLSGLLRAEQEDRGRLGALGKGRIWIAFGLFLSLVGAYVVVEELSTPAAPRFIEAVVLIGAGCAIVLTRLLNPQNLERRPNFLVVSSRGISLGRLADSRLNEIFWTNSGVYLILIDRRKLDQRPNAQETTSPLFLSNGGGPSIPIPEGAFDRILAEARVHHLDVSQQMFGSVAWISIRSRHSSKA